jgi:RNA polymerase sigma-70 factor (ECF subfamily)
LKLLATQFVGQYSDAEDIAQEALARAFRHVDRFDPRYRFSTWLYTIAIRLAHDFARSQRRRPRQVCLENVDCASQESTVAWQAQQQEEVGNLWATAKRVLSEDQYTAMWLRYGEDMSAVEVAKTMRKSRIGVRVLLHRARLAMVAVIEQEDSSKPDREDTNDTHNP